MHHGLYILLTFNWDRYRNGRNEWMNEWMNEFSPWVVFNSYSYATHSDISQKGPFIKYVTLFWTNFDSPLSVTLCHTSRTQIFSSTCIHTCLYRGFVLIREFFLFGGISGGFLSGRFRPGWFLSIPASVRIHPLQQKTKYHFQF